MEILSRISSTFENVRSTIKTKKSSDRLQQIKNGIQVLGSELEVLGKENHDQFVRSLAMGGYLALLSAKTMPMTLVEKRNVLQASYDKLQPYILREECLFVFLRTQNLLCANLIQLDQLTEAQHILEVTEELYEKIDREQSHRYLDAEELFTAMPIDSINIVNPDKIDKVITNNVLMQAYLYNKMNMPEKYTLYNHTALRRQLEMKDGTAQEWAMRTARLGNYFTHICQLGNAHYHLCAAYHVLRTCHDNCRLMPEAFVQQKAEFEMHFLELSHYWVKYGLILFKVSKKKILSKYFSESKTDLWRTVDQLGVGERKREENNENCKDFGSEKNGEGDFTQLYSFPTLNLKEMEARVPSEPVCSDEAARKLFSFTHKWLMRAKHYYDMEQYASQYLSCSMQLAELYEHLVFFEKNVDAQYALQRRRADVLESLTALLRSCDMTSAVQIDVIRELSQVQLELMALNLQKLWREESRTNIFHLHEHDADSIINSLESAESMKTITAKTLNASSKNLFLHKMEAATSLNGKLFRLSGQLQNSPPSQLSFESTLI